MTRSFEEGSDEGLKLKSDTLEPASDQIPELNSISRLEQSGQDEKEELPDGISRNSSEIEEQIPAVNLSSDMNALQSEIIQDKSDSAVLALESVSNLGSESKGEIDELQISENVEISENPISQAQEFTSDIQIPNTFYKTGEVASDLNVCDKECPTDETAAEDEKREVSELKTYNENTYGSSILLSNSPSFGQVSVEESFEGEPSHSEQCSSFSYITESKLDDNETSEIEPKVEDFNLVDSNKREICCSKIGINCKDPEANKGLEKQEVEQKRNLRSIVGTGRKVDKPRVISSYKSTMANRFKPRIQKPGSPTIKEGEPLGGLTMEYCNKDYRPSKIAVRKVDIPSKFPSEAKVTLFPYRKSAKHPLTPHTGFTKIPVPHPMPLSPKSPRLIGNINPVLTVPKPQLSAANKARLEATKSRFEEATKSSKLYSLRSALYFNTQTEGKPEDRNSNEHVSHMLGTESPEIPSENILGKQEIGSGSEVVLMHNVPHVSTKHGTRIPRPATNKFDIPPQELRTSLGTTPGKLSALVTRYRAQSKRFASQPGSGTQEKSPIPLRISKSIESNLSDEGQRSSFSANDRIIGKVQEFQDATQAVLQRNPCKVETKPKETSPGCHVIMPGKLSALLTRYRVQRKRYDSHSKDLDALQDKMVATKEAIKALKAQIIAANSGEIPDEIVSPPQSASRSPIVRKPSSDFNILPVSIVEIENKNLKDELMKSNAEIKSHKEHITTLIAESKHLVEKVNKFRNALDEQKKYFSENQENKNQQLSDELQKFKKMYEDEKNKRLSSDKRKNSEMSQLNVKLETEIAKRGAIEHTLNKAIKQKEEVEIKLMKAEEQIESLKAMIEGKNKTISELDPNLFISSMEELLRKKERIKVLEGDLIKEKDYSTKLRDEIKCHENDQKSITAEVDDLSRSLKEKKEIIDEMSKQLTLEATLRKFLAQLVSNICAIVGCEVDESVLNETAIEEQFDKSTLTLQIMSSVKGKIEGKNSELENYKKTISEYEDLFKEKQTLIDELLDSAKKFENHKCPKIDETVVKEENKTNGILINPTVPIPNSLQESFYKSPEDNNSIPSLNELYEMLEMKRSALQRMELKIRELQEIHAHCSMRRSLQESRIAELEFKLAGYQD